MAVDEPPDIVARWFQEGINMATIGVDWSFMRQAINKSANEINKLLEKARKEVLKVGQI
jgi:2-keto-3-deoxy-L-rhamnonate aldolase RhmA